MGSFIACCGGNNKAEKITIAKKAEIEPEQLEHDSLSNKSRPLSNSPAHKENINQPNQEMSQSLNLPPAPERQLKPEVEQLGLSTFYLQTLENKFQQKSQMGSMDINKMNMINREEVGELIGELHSNVDEKKLDGMVDGFFDNLDKNQQGQVRFNEFMNIWYQK